MNTSVKMILVLTIITTLTGGLLSSWDGFTAPKIRQHRLEAIRQAVSEVLPAHARYEKVENENTIFYVGKDTTGKTVGIAFTVEGSGFQGEISMMVGMNPNFSTITGLQILAQVETPGLGTKIVSDPSNKRNPTWFTDQFNGVDPVPEIKTVKNEKPDTPNEVQAITGATISSKSVVKILNESIKRAKQKFQTKNERIS